MTLACGSQLILLARTWDGYDNLSRFFTLANAAGRRNPCLDPQHLPQRASGLTLLTGGRDGPLSVLLAEGHRPEGVSNTRRIAEMCEFDLSTDLGYPLRMPTCRMVTLPAATCNSSATRPPSGATAR